MLQFLASLVRRRSGERIRHKRQGHEIRGQNNSETHSLIPSPLDENQNYWLNCMFIFLAACYVSGNRKCCYILLIMQIFHQRFLRGLNSVTAEGIKVGSVGEKVWVYVVLHWQGRYVLFTVSTYLSWWISIDWRVVVTGRCKKQKVALSMLLDKIG